ncbi:MAG: tripartite tricarboxylate transporter substrate binding protein [Xanthobacteraceae bacterium]|nr:tripartite tricarboxylate transporter substrate binding protein [Xanthobacteraceae bacterium]
MKLTAFLIALLMLTATYARAEDWPARPVRIIAPFAPGGTADTLGRVAAEHLSQAFHQDFFVENRPGAGGVTASLAVARMEPDGYNFVVSGIATHAIAPVINSNTGYDPVNDFTHVAYFGGPPIVFIVPKELGVKTLAEFVTYAKSRKEPLTFASPGTGTSGQLVAEYFAQKAGIKIEHIPYRGAAPGVMDVMAGQLTFGSMTWTTASGQISAGTVVPLATSAPQRLADFPTIPTFKEEGYPDLVSTTWFALAGPARLPKDVVMKVNQEVVKAFARPEVLERLKVEQIITEPMTPDELTRFVAAEYARWRPVAEQAHLVKTN